MSSHKDFINGEWVDGGPREQGRYAREFYTVVKTAYTAP